MMNVDRLLAVLNIVVTVLVAMAGVILTVLYASRNEIVLKNIYDAVMTQARKSGKALLVTLKSPSKRGFVAKCLGAPILLLIALSPWLSQREDGPSLTPTVVPADQIGYVGQPLPSPVAVQVQTNSVPMEGATVMFAPTSGGTATPDAVATDSAGRAQTVWTLGCRSGKQTLVARVLGGGSMSIPATARPASVPTRIEITPDSAKLTSVGDTAGFSARLLDQCDNEFPGKVVWSSIRQCVFKAGSDGLATALRMGTDSIVATFGNLRATAPVTVESGAR